MHIQCVGTGSPAVVLDAGLGRTSLDWNLVQAEMGRTTQVCAYDRAGMGWSETGPQPRTPGQIARELHTLLTNAGIPGPYGLPAGARKARQHLSVGPRIGPGPSLRREPGGDACDEDRDAPRDGALYDWTARC